MVYLSDNQIREHVTKVELNLLADQYVNFHYSKAHVIWRAVALSNTVYAYDQRFYNPIKSQKDCILVKVK